MTTKKFISQPILKAQLGWIARKLKYIVTPLTTTVKNQTQQNKTKYNAPKMESTLRKITRTVGRITQALIPTIIKN